MDFREQNFKSRITRSIQISRGLTGAKVFRKNTRKDAKNYNNQELYAPPFLELRPFQPPITLSLPSIGCLHELAIRVQEINLQTC